MAVLIDLEGYTKLVDAVAAGTESSGAIIGAGFRQLNPWDDRPNASGMERQMSEAMRVAAVPSDVIRAIKPNLPVNPHPDGVRFDRTPLTVSDALDVNRWSPKVRSWTSGPVKPVRRSEVEQDTWGGTLRGSTSTVNPMM